MTVTVVFGHNLGQLQGKSEEIESLTKSKISLNEQFNKYRKQEGSSIVSVREFEQKLHAEEKHVKFLEAEVFCVQCLARQLSITMALHFDVA